MKNATRKVLFLALASILSFVPSSSAPADQQTENALRPDAPYTAAKSDPISHEADLSIVVTPPYHCDVLRVWVPVPQSDAAQQVSDSRFSTFPMQNSWLLLTKGTDYELVPPASRPVRVVRTAYVEADGEPLPDPDPANIEKREFAWMTAHQYQADRSFKLPFKDLSTLSVDDRANRHRGHHNN